MKPKYVNNYDVPSIVALLSKYLNFVEGFGTFQKVNTGDQGNKPPKAKKINVGDFNKDPQYYLKMIQRMLNFNEQETVLFLRRIYTLYPGAFISVLLRIIAVTLDKKYEDHIYDTNTVWVFNTINSKVYPIEVATIKQVAFKYFAAFRSKEEAIFGIKMANAIKHYVFEWQTEK